MNPVAALLVALVAEDATPLRSAPSDSAPAQATLYRGDWLEVRGQAPGFLKVWDHRRERPGYVRPARVRTYRSDESAAGELFAVVRFLREAPAAESLGIGHAALYLWVTAKAKRSPAEHAEVLGALGAMADRLALRASGRGTRRPGDSDATLAGQLGVAESYGIKLERFEHPARGDGRTREHTVVCYDGDAFVRVLDAAAAAAEERARAALALTRPACVDPAASVQQRRAWNQRRLTILGEANPARPELSKLPRPLAHQIRLRTAEALVEEIHARAAAGDAAAATLAAEALRSLALVDRGELAPEELPTYHATALRVAGVRWLTEPRPSEPRGPIAVEIAAGAPGQTCVRVRPRAPSAPAAARFERCTFGVVFASSLQVATNGRAVSFAVAPVPGWTELWLLRQDASGTWQAEVVPPAAGQPGEDVGYVELAGFAPEGRLLLVREFLLGDRLGKRFEVRSATGAVLHWASTPERLGAFVRWSSPTWRRSTLALR